MATHVKMSKKERKRQIPAKTSLNSPYNPQWIPLPQEDMHYILDTLKKKLTTIGLEKREVREFRSWGKKKNKKTEKDDLVTELPQVPHDTQVQNLPKEPSECGWTDLAARRQLAIGINEVTKALERNQLRLMLVCKSVKPPHMISHLIALSRTRNVPACQVPRLSESISEPLGLKCVLALGFRRGDGQVDGTFSDVVDAIIPRVPSLEVTWISDTDPIMTAEGPVEAVDDTGERGQKRKIEHVSPEIANVSCALQPLKVKRIIPNPSKTRKPNIKKK